MGIVLLILGIIVLGSVTIAFVPVRRDPFTGTTFVVGWLTGELAGQFALLDILILALLLPLGAASKVLGEIGLVLDLLGLVGLVALLLIGRRARGVVAACMAETPGFPIEMGVADFRPVWGRWWRVARGIPLPGRGTKVVRNVDYVGDGARRHRLDIFSPEQPEPGAPVLLYVHGGAWVIGDKREQGRPLMYELASRGWVCVAANYRLSPAATWPDHIVDVLSAVAWVKENIADYGGDASFLAIAGGSAGGHLAALAALAAGDPSFQPGFEDADTTVDACIPIYGVLDMTCDPKTSGKYGPGLRILLERRVFKAKLRDERPRFEAASPLHRVSPAAPPFLVVHGTHDTLVPVAVPRAFVPALRAASREPVAYIELPMAQHAFDVLASPRTSAATAGMVAFLEAVRERSSAIENQQPEAAQE